MFLSCLRLAISSDKKKALIVTAMAFSLQFSNKRKRENSIAAFLLASNNKGIICLARGELWFEAGNIKIVRLTNLTKESSQWPD